MTDDTDAVERLIRAAGRRASPSPVALGRMREAQHAAAMRVGWRGAGVLIGIAWALWHLPLLFMADTAQAGLPIGLFLISTVGLSVVMARLGVHTRFSVLPALLLHSVINWWSMVVPISADGRAYALVAGIATLVSLAALLKRGPTR
jgi:membrane protease YdiL (CAAX protease family)